MVEGIYRCCARAACSVSAREVSGPLHLADDSKEPDQPGSSEAARAWHPPRKHQHAGGEKQPGGRIGAGLNLLGYHPGAGRGKRCSCPARIRSSRAAAIADANSRTIRWWQTTQPARAAPPCCAATRRPATVYCGMKMLPRARDRAARVYHRLPHAAVCPSRPGGRFAPSRSERSCAICRLHRAIPARIETPASTHRHRNR